MPRVVRNFWIEAEVDGRKTPIAFGPTGKDGGFSLTVYMRNAGEVERVVRIHGAQGEEDRLLLQIRCEGAWEMLRTYFSTRTKKWCKLLTLYRQR